MEWLSRLGELLADNTTVAGRAATTAVIMLLAVALAALAGRLVARRVDDPLSRYHLRKLSRYVVAVLALVVLALYWRPFAGQLGVMVGIITAGVAFAMQEVIGAVAGWFNILSGRIFRVGDRIQMGGVRGDVIDITPLRTKIMEMGSATDETAWVRGRQYTGRVIAVSNKATFTEPVFNYSTGFEYLWEELAIPVPHDSDWQQAERILDEEARRISASRTAQAAMRDMAKRYPVPLAEVAPRVFVEATDNWMQLSARFVVPVRTARSVKDQLTRRVRARLRDAGIDIASETLDTTVRQASP